MTPQEWKDEIERRDEIIASYKALYSKCWNDAIEAAASVANRKDENTSSWELMTDEILALKKKFTDYRTRTGIDVADVIAKLSAGTHVLTENWQPIGTAPQDGTDVLVSGGTYVCEMIGHEGGGPLEYVAKAWFDSDDNRWCECGFTNTFFKPTHWMPLPAFMIRAAQDNAPNNAPNSPL